MSYSLENSTDLTNLADAIRSLTETSETMTVAEMAEALGNYTPPSGGSSSGAVITTIPFAVAQSNTADFAIGQNASHSFNMGNDNEWLFLYCYANTNELNAINSTVELAHYVDGELEIQKIQDEVNIKHSCAVSYDNTLGENVFTITNTSTTYNETMWFGKCAYIKTDSELGYIYGYQYSFNSIPSDSVILDPSTDLTFTGNIGSKFQGSGVAQFFNMFDGKITFKDITGLGYAFQGNTMAHFPTDKITFAEQNLSGQINYVFENCNSLQEVPALVVPSGYTYTTENINGFFNSCNSLLEIPRNYFSNITFGSGDIAMGNLINLCWHLRGDIPLLPANHGYSTNGLFVWQRMYCLDQITEVPVNSNTVTSNMFGSLDKICRIKEFTFATDNGTPYTANWKGQEINFQANKYIGYQNPGQSWVESIIGNSKRVTDAASYEALKNDPDWWSSDIAYCRYNHDSAVNTINSLPDCSAYLATAGGTNTIIFAGASGSATDGGAISNLTSAEIAVATAKGWTVSIV